MHTCPETPQQPAVQHTVAAHPGLTTAHPKYNSNTVSSSKTVFHHEKEARPTTQASPKTAEKVAAQQTVTAPPASFTAHPKHLPHQQKEGKTIIASSFLSKQT
jgi:hypothetical protein